MPTDLHSDFTQRSGQGCANAGASRFTFMENTLIPDGETLDDLKYKNLFIFQKKSGFRFGMDSVLLSDFAQIKPKDIVVDLGCGSGILMLLLWAREKGSRFIGIDIQSEIAEMAQRSIKYNHLESQMKVLCKDLNDVQDKDIPSESIDCVICNPPYGESGRWEQSPFPAVAAAKMQKENLIENIFRLTKRILKGKGRIYLIYPAAQMFNLMETMRSYSIEPKRFRLVYSNTFKPADLVLIEGIKNAKPLLHPMPPLIIRTESGSLTNELKSIYHIQE